jgi:hypothetical protein
MTLTPSECAKLGSQRSREVSAEIKHKNIEKYLRSPKLCKKCKSIISYEKRRNSFCSMSCAASIRNLGQNRHTHTYKDIAKRTAYLQSDKYKSMRALAQNIRKGSKRELMLSVFGNICTICNFEKRITIHRKDGKTHTDFGEMSWEEINNVITNERNEYISVCYKCHNHVHWCMRILGMSWNDIYKLLLTIKTNTVIPAYAPDQECKSFNTLSGG